MEEGEDQAGGVEDQVWEETGVQAILYFIVYITGPCV